MILISHRGNLFGPNPAEENKPDYISAAIEKGFDVEIDVWYCDGVWALGHNEPQYETDIDFLSQNDLWLHCKNYEAFQILSEKMETDFNFFYHTNEDYVLTGRHYVWAFPGKRGGDNTICVMPEYNKTDITGFSGVCSDYIGEYND